MTLNRIPLKYSLLLQPMDQQVNFKKLYTKETVPGMLPDSQNTDLTLILVGTLQQHPFSKRTLRSTWERVQSKIIQERDFENCIEEPEPSIHTVVDDTVRIGESIGLQVNSGVVEELVEEFSEELSIEDLQQLQAKQQEIAANQLSKKEEKNQQSTQQNSEIKTILKNWTVKNIWREDPPREKADHCIHLLNYNIM